MPPAERVVAFVFSHDGFRARPPAPFYKLAGPATWDACSIDRKHEDYRDKCPKSEGPARLRSGGAGSGCEARHRGRSSLCATGLFSVWRGLYPYKPHVGAFVGGGRIGHVRYRISRHVRYRPGCFDFHAGGSIVGQMVFGLAPRSAGRMKKPLVKVRLASGFSYVGYEGSIDGADLVDEPRAVEIVQLGADGVGRFAVDHADEKATKRRYLARYLSGPFSFIWRLNIAK